MRKGASDRERAPRRSAEVGRREGGLGLLLPSGAQLLASSPRDGGARFAKRVVAPTQPSGAKHALSSAYL